MIMRMKLRVREAWRAGLMVTALQACACALVLGFSALGNAQQVDLNQFRPSVSATDGFAINSAADQGHLRYGVQLYTDYAADSLSFDRALGGTIRVVHSH